MANFRTRRPLGVRLGTGLGVVAALALSACTNPVASSPDGVKNPRSLALVCLGTDGVRLDLADCKYDSGVRALVGSGAEGAVAIAHPSGEKWLDTDPSVPGYTPLTLDGQPGAMAFDAVTSQVYVALTDTREIARVDVAELAAGRVKVLDRTPLSFDPAGMVLVHLPQPRLVIADPAGGRLWTIAPASLGGDASPTSVDIGGSPATLALAEATGQVYVGHLREGHVTVWDPATSSVVSRISFTAACQNGLDDDGDGQVDRADSGCDSPLDRTEGNPELGALCGNNLDDDGDGQTDVADLGCAPTPTTDTCRNGVDDDSDGLTDYPADPGCNGFGDDSEWSDNPSCRDGYDNDGDGQTDATDPQCVGTPNGVEASAPGGLPVGANDLPGCANGTDDDGDGKTDLADSGCYNRASAGEIAASTDPLALVATTFGGKYAVVADRAHRTLFVIDTATRTLLQPQVGQITPFARASRFDLREGLAGLTVSQLPTALGPVRLGTRDLIAVGLSPAGLVFLQIEGEDGTRSIGLITSSSVAKTTASRPNLTVDNVTLDIGAQAPAKYASLGSLTEQNSTERRYYGLQFTEEQTHHRTETWRFTREGVLPGGERNTGRFVKPSELHDPYGDFCRMGVVAGDTVILPRTGAPACGGLGEGPVQYRVTAVRPGSLDLDPASGRRDVPVTAANQISWDATLATAVPLPDLGCLPEGGVHYIVRSQGWLVSGSRSGLLSSRDSVDGACAVIPADELQGSRLLEPKLKAGAQLATCPPLKAGVLDPALDSVTLQHAVFSVQLVPGCVKLDSTQPPALLASIRDAVWAVSVSSGFAARVSDVGPVPVALQSGPSLSRVYVVDQGTGTLSSVTISTGEVVTTLR